MGRLTIMIAATSVLLAVTRAESQTPRDSVVATVNEFFRAMTARDTAALARVQFADGILYAARMQGDSVAIRRGTFEGFAQQLAGTRDTYVERMWEPTVLMHGPLAVVWAPYDFHRNTHVLALRHRRVHTSSIAHGLEDRDGVVYDRGHGMQAEPTGSAAMTGGRRQAAGDRAIKARRQTVENCRLQTADCRRQRTEELFQLSPAACRLPPAVLTNVDSRHAHSTYE
jgi:hypothetical protein